MLDAALFHRYRSVPDPLWLAVGGRLFDVQQRWSGTEVVVDGLDRLPAEPVILATNASHRYDWLALRCDLRRRGIPVVSIAKGKYFQQATMSLALGKVGVVPIVSRGYVIVVDFLAVHARRPDEAEYRAIRAHVDEDTPLPSGAVFDGLATRDRLLLGLPFRPAEERYRSAIHRVYEHCMQETTRLARLAVQQRHHVHIYPEGTVSSRLADGRRGTVQFARALGIPILPVGMSGCREAFRSSGSIRMRGGRIVLRFGEVWRDADAELPRDFRPFDPAHEQQFGPALDRATASLMERLDTLVAPEYRRVPGGGTDGTSGVARFL